MRIYLCFVLIVILSAEVIGQQPDKQVQIEHMKKVLFLEGNWEGKGWYRGPDRKMNYFDQTEAVRSNLGGLILQIEGKGTMPDSISGEPVLFHHAFAVVSYDEKLEKFKMRSFKDGNFLETDAEIGEDGSFIWGFALPGNEVKLRYTISLNEKGEWFETGEFSYKGGNWIQNFEMTLSKVR